MATVLTRKNTPLDLVWETTEKYVEVPNKVARTLLLVKGGKVTIASGTSRFAVGSLEVTGATNGTAVQIETAPFMILDGGANDGCIKITPASGASYAIVEEAI